MKKVSIEIDLNAGFCFGVTNSIKKTEELLKNREEIYVLGELVHNEEELNRLKKLGLKEISYKDIDLLKGKEIIIRAHGEPPSTYEKLQKIDAKIYDFTCPIVLHLQKKISTIAEKMQKLNGLIVIYGLKNHPEVVGLLGHTKNRGIVVENIEQAKEVVLDKPIALFSQTTKDKEGFEKIEEYFRTELNKRNIHFESYATMCKIVAKRAPALQKFAKEHDFIIFVSGKESSNGKYLYNIAKTANPNTIFVSLLSDIDEINIPTDVKSIGISGATSTPLSLLELIKENLEKKLNN
ncbi:MAG TPA: 4-hydroxy-3-methylbut-2-enyl diphosphate reductase [Bacteroidales bacterium]|nr:4-hydroxy-3-methylbut-2-enyl diphosphate reductase [Bacteroidales bacterium]